MVVIDGLDERLNLAALGLATFRHATGDLGWVSLNAGHQGVGEWVRLRACVERLNDDNLIAINRQRASFLV